MNENVRNRVIYILETAKKLLIERGWVNKCLQRDGHICMVRAIELANVDNLFTRETELNAQRMVRKAIGHWDMIRWEDMDGRTLDEVLAVFDEAVCITRSDFPRTLVKRFVDQCVIGEPGISKRDNTLPFKDLYRAYSKWVYAKPGFFFPVGRKHFRQHMQSLGFARERKSEGIIWRGIVGLQNIPA